MGQALGQQGAGVLGVGKRVERMAEGLMGRLAGYEGALDRLAVEGESAALRAALRRNVFGTLPEAEGDLAGLVAYVLAQAAALDAQPGEALRLGDRKSVV